MAVQFGIILALIARQGLQAAIKKYGRSAVSQATSKAARDAAKKSTKNKNKEVLKQLEKKKIEEKASENILKRQMEKEQVEGTVKSAAERRASYASPRQAQKSRDTLKDKGREKRLEKERQSRGDLDDAFIEEGERFPDKFTTSEGNPISLRFAEGGEVNKGIEALRKEAPEVVARMGYGLGGAASKLSKNLLKLFKKDEKVKNIVKEIEKQKEYIKTKGYEKELKEMGESVNDLTRDEALEYTKDFAEYELGSLEGLLESRLSYLAERKIIDKTKKEAEKTFYKKIEGGDDIPFAEGGDVDAQMAMLMPTEEEPIMEEQEQDMVSDEQMEDEYLDFIIDQSLSPEEETTLMTKLEADPELSVMFDKVMDTAMEFAGSGPVDGPGSGVSDSIPARLSDGEFVFTAKATEQIGADRLQSMMEDAEAEADASMRQDMQMGGEVEEKPKVDRFGKPIDEDIAEDEIKKGMMSVNPRMQ